MMRYLLPLFLTAALLPMPPAQAAEPAEVPVDRETLTLLQSDEYFTRMAVGDVYPLHPGNESVVVGRDQKVHVLFGSWPHFEDIVAYSDSWYLMAVAVGDVLPEFPGDEIVVGGWSYVVTLIWWDNGFKHKQIYFYKDWIYDVEVADIDPGSAGMEVVVAGETGAVTLLRRAGGYNFTSQTIYKDQYFVDGIYAGDFDPTRPGVEVAAATGSFKVVEIYSENVWKNEVIWNEGAQMVEVDGGELDPLHPGEELVAGGVKGRAVLLKKTGDEWSGEILYTIPGSLRTIYDVDVGDGDPTHPGSEVLISSWDGNSYMLYPPSGGAAQWEVKSVFHSDYLLIGGEMGDFDPTRPGGEVMVCDSGGGLYAVYSSPPGAFIYCGENYTLNSSGATVFPLHVHYTPSFDRNVRLSGVFVEGGGEVEFTPASLSTSGSVTVKVSGSEGGVLEISLVEENTGRTVATRRVNLYRVEEWFTLEVDGAVRVPYGHSTTFTLNIMGTPPGETLLPTPLQGLSFSPARLSSTEGEVTVNLTTTGTPPVGIYPFRAVVPAAGVTYYFTLEVGSPTGGDFNLYISPSAVTLRPGEEVTLDGAVLPVGVFTGTAQLSVEEAPPGLEVNLSTQSVEVGVPFTITVRCPEGGEPSPPQNFRVNARVGENVRFRIITVTVVSSPAGVKISAPERIKVKEGGVATLEITLTPTGGNLTALTVTAVGEGGLGVEEKNITLNHLSSPAKLVMNVTAINTPPGEYALNITVRYSTPPVGEAEENYTVTVVVEGPGGGDGGSWFPVAVFVAFLAASLLYIFLRKKGIGGQILRKPPKGSADKKGGRQGEV